MFTASEIAIPNERELFSPEPPSGTPGDPAQRPAAGLAPGISPADGPSGRTPSVWKGAHPAPPPLHSAGHSGKMSGSAAKVQHSFSG